MTVGMQSHWPLYIYCEPPENFGAIDLRGGPYFDALAEFGIEVIRVPAGQELSFRPREPWSFLYAPVSTSDTTEYMRQIQSGPCSIILDVHFPIMNQETAIGDDATILSLLESREVMLKNLAAACAVTVSHQDWAADLAEINDRVWFLPDLDPDNEDSIMDFTTKFSEICGETAKMCRGIWEANRRKKEV